MPKFKNQLRLIATALYLIAAFVVTAATSKSQPGQNGHVLSLMGGTTNYTVETDCPNHPDIVALRVKMGKIHLGLTSGGQLVSARQLDFRHFGFPQADVLVGMDQYSTEPNSKEVCTVQEKSSRPNPTYDASKTKYFFLQPGSLTRIVYQCTTKLANTCTTILEELPAGRIGPLNPSAKPAAR